MDDKYPEFKKGDIVYYVAKGTRGIHKVKEGIISEVHEKMVRVEGRLRHKDNIKITVRS